MSYPFRTHAAALASGLAVASTVASASAQLTGTEVESYAAAALYVTYAFGAKQGVGLGFEGRVGARELEIEQCDVDANEAFPYGGGALRLEWFPASHTRLLIVGQAGHTFATIMGAHGELGVGYRWGERAGFDTVLGAELDLSVTAFGLHFDVMRPELSGSAGFVIPPVWLRPNSCWVAGRPQRAEHGYAPLPALALSGTTRNNAPPEVARIWGARAQTEWASVPAFRELADQLRAFEAPAALVSRCYDAFSDEVSHALLAGGHCANLGSGRVALSRNVTSARPLLAGQAALVRLAIESWVDGCLGEGAAAACAAQEATSTTRPDIRSTQQRIAQDEARHAELAWDVLQWSLQAGGRDVREALHATAAAKPADPATDHAGDSFEEYGIASNAQHEAIAEAQRQRAVQRLDAMLAS